MKKISKNCIGILAGCAYFAALSLPIALNAADDVLVGEQGTPVGSSVRISPLNEIEIYFSQVSRAGVTTVTREISTEQFPNLDFGSPAYVYRVSTTALVSGPITVCVSFDTERFVVPNGEVRLWQIDGDSTLNITRGYGWTYACGPTDHLSSFVAAQNFGVAPIRFSHADTANATSSFQASSDATLSASTNAAQSQDPHVSHLQFFSAEGDAILTIVNGPVPTTGARVLLNGKVVGTGALFKKNQNNLFSPVRILAGTNTLEVSVDGGPGSSFTLSIQRAQNIP